MKKCSRFNRKVTLIVQINFNCKCFDKLITVLVLYRYFNLLRQKEKRYTFLINRNENGFQF